ncbi:MAG TPA: tetratricopeptide repeat protein [Gaiellaceae bacterium]|nr:tetratricopeptide repeat protein [Gaiellaceae bacterium]
MPRQKSTHVDDPHAVGLRLRAAREKAGLSQRQLAFPGCSPAYISRIESGDRIPSLQLLRELGRRLGVTEDWLATGTEDGRYEASGALLEAEVALRLEELDLAERLFTTMLEHAGADITRAQAHEGLGQVAHRRGRPREAIERFERALELYGTPESQHADLADSLGRAYAMVGELESAIGVFERCLEQAEQDGDVLRGMQFMVLLGHALIDAGNFGRAEELLGRALAIGKDSQSPSVRAQLYWTQSRLHAERNEPELAARYARRALEVLRLTEDTYRTARAHQLLAHIELDRGHPEAALEVLHEGWPLLERNANPLERAQYRLEEARALARLGREEEAGTLVMQISGIIAGAHPEDAARSYSTLAEIFEDLGDRARALELYELAAELLRPNNPNRYLVAIFARMAELYEAEGRTDAAYEYMKMAVGMQNAVASKLGHPR